VSGSGDGVGEETSTLVAAVSVGRILWGSAAPASVAPQLLQQRAARHSNRKDWAPMAMAVPLLLVLAQAGISHSSSKDELAFGIEVAKRGLWNEARFRFERAVALDPESAEAHNDLGVALEQQGEFVKARAAFEKALELSPNSIYIQQNYDLFREADDKRNRKKKK
jgi:Flp pilus assembly protein TadD